MLVTEADAYAGVCLLLLLPFLTFALSSLVCLDACCLRCHATLCCSIFLTCLPFLQHVLHVGSS